MRILQALVLCSHGAGFLVSWDAVPEYAHIGTQSEEEEVQEEELRPKKPSFMLNGVIDQEEIDEIFARTFGQQNRREIHRRRQSRLLMTVHIGEHSLLMYRERRNIFWLTAIISFLPGKN